MEELVSTFNAVKEAQNPTLIRKAFMECSLSEVKIVRATLEKADYKFLGEVDNLIEARTKRAEEYKYYISIGAFDAFFKRLSIEDMYELLKDYRPVTPADRDLFVIYYQVLLEALREALKTKKEKESKTM